MLKAGWLQYLSQPALPVSLAAVFLYFNIGLAPGNLMTSFLIQKGKCIDPFNNPKKKMVYLLDDYL
jgi:hypothetical protein